MYTVFGEFGDSNQLVHSKLYRTLQNNTLFFVAISGNTGIVYLLSNSGAMMRSIKFIDQVPVVDLANI